MALLSHTVTMDLNALAGAIDPFTGNVVYRGTRTTYAGPYTQVDVTSYIDFTEGLDYSYGRQDPFAETPAPGILTLTLDNADGRFTPGNPLGFYTQGIANGVMVVWTTGTRVRKFTIESATVTFPAGTAGSSQVVVRCRDAIGKLATQQCRSMLELALLRNPYGVAPIAYWALDEGQGTLEAGESSGNISIPLKPWNSDDTHMRSLGWGNGGGPGYDGKGALIFNQSFNLSDGSPQGSAGANWLTTGDQGIPAPASVVGTAAMTNNGTIWDAYQTNLEFWAAPPSLNDAAGTDGSTGQPGEVLVNTAVTMFEFADPNGFRFRARISYTYQLANPGLGTPEIKTCEMKLEYRIPNGAGYLNAGTYSTATFTPDSLTHHFRFVFSASYTAGNYGMIAAVSVDGATPTTYTNWSATYPGPSAGNKTAYWQMARPGQIVIGGGIGISSPPAAFKGAISRVALFAAHVPWQVATSGTTGVVPNLLPGQPPTDIALRRLIGKGQLTERSLARAARLLSYSGLCVDSWPNYLGLTANFGYRTSPYSPVLGGGSTPGTEKTDLMGPQNTAGQSFLDAICDAMRVERAMLYCDGGSLNRLDEPVLFRLTDNQHPYAVLWTIDVQQDAAAVTSFVRDVPGRVSAANASSYKASSGYADQTLQVSIGTVSAAVSSAHDTTAGLDRLAEDRVAAGAATRFWAQAVVVDRQLQTPTQLDLHLATVGSRVQLTGLPSTQMGQTYADHYLIGVDEFYTHGSEQFTLYLEPADAPPEGMTDPGGGSVSDRYFRISAGPGYTLTAGITSSATSMQVTRLTGLPAFTTAAGDYPLMLELQGERVTATAAPSTINATTQQFTITRASDGTVARAHVSGEVVELAGAPVASL